MNYNAYSSQFATTSQTAMSRSSAASPETATPPPTPGSPHQGYLRQLGDRVRDARARRGMTRKALSRDSGVSERYLAQLEGGNGNISIALLRQIAQAMNLPLTELVREGAEPPVELALLQSYLTRLSGAQLSEAQEILIGRFGASRERAGRVALVGLRGAGKTTVGRLLADRLAMPFIELAREIEADAGMPVGEVFSLSGQAAFRRYERRSLERVIERHDRAVIATGGGIVAEPATLEILLDACHTVWLRATPEEHMRRVIEQGDRRPMAGNAEAMRDLKRILGNREALYAKADFTVASSGRPPERLADEIAGLLEEPIKQA